MIEENHGRDKIIPNLHLSFYLYDCLADYEPLYAFWCFSFERMNGILGSLPNSNRKIKSKLICRLIFDSQIDSIISSGIETKGLDLLENRPSVGSLSITNQFLSDEIYRFWMSLKNIKESQIFGHKEFPGEFFKPSSENVLISSEILDLMVKYYIATYNNLEFRKPFDEDSEDAIII